METNRLVAVVFEVSDLDRSLALYRDGFGLDLHVGDHRGDDRWTSGRHALEGLVMLQAMLTPDKRAPRYVSS